MLCDEVEVGYFLSIRALRAVLKQQPISTQLDESA
jgi:hypothetical protein